MRLKSFRIKNYRSIVDSGECRFSDTDNVLILAGQNESGKSAILNALHDFARAELAEDSRRELDGTDPQICCTYFVEQDDDIVGHCAQANLYVPKALGDALGTFTEISFVRTFPEGESRLDFGETLNQKITELWNEALDHEENALESRDKPSDRNTGNAEDLTQGEDEELDEESDDDEDVNVNEETDEGQDASFPSSRAEGRVIRLSELAYQLFTMAPTMIFFDDFCDLLPDKILLQDLVSKNPEAKGYNAVRNVEKILKTNFSEYDSLSDAQRASRSDKNNHELTADFNQRWKQRIFDDNTADGT